jgi:hypothetical protein
MGVQRWAPHSPWGVHSHVTLEMSLKEQFANHKLKLGGKGLSGSCVGGAQGGHGNMTRPENCKERGFGHSGRHAGVGLAGTGA